MTLGAMSHASSGVLRTVAPGDQGIQLVADAPGANQGARQWRVDQFTERAISPTPARAATSALLLPCVPHAGVDPRRDHRMAMEVPVDGRAFPPNESAHRASS